VCVCVCVAEYAAQRITTTRGWSAKSYRRMRRRRTGRGIGSKGHTDYESKDRRTEADRTDSEGR